MIKLQALENFSLERFNEIEMVERAGKEQNKWINKNDIFKCSKDLADYLLGANPLGRPVVKVIEVEPKKEQWAVTEEEDGNIHVRPVVNDEIIDTPVGKIIKPKSSKNKKSSKK